MDSKCAIFIVLGSLLIMAIFSSITNSVSAASECFGEGSLDHVFCFTMVGEPPEIHVFECMRDANGNWDCHGITKKATPPGIDQVIANTIQEVGPSNLTIQRILAECKLIKVLQKAPSINLP